MQYVIGRGFAATVGRSGNYHSSSKISSLWVDPIHAIPHFFNNTVLNYSTGLILVCGLLMSLVGENYSGKPMMLTFLAVVVGMIVLGISEIRYKTRPCDEIIRQIEAFETTTNKETGLNKKQQLFCIAMIVAFVGLDIWAYTIVGTYLKLPPMWRNVLSHQPKFRR